MDYAEILNQLSEEIFDLKNDRPSLGFIQTKSLKNLKVYKKNLLGGVLKLLNPNYVVTRKYLGEKNFQFFVRLYILENKVRFSQIADLALNFPLFLKQKYEYHEDDILESLALLDSLWSQTETLEVQTPLGMVEYWKNLDSGADCSKITINFNEMQRVCLIVNDDEKRMVVK